MQKDSTGKYYDPVQTPTVAFRTDTTTNDASVTVDGNTIRCGTGALEHGQPDIDTGSTGFMVAGFDPHSLKPIAVNAPNCFPIYFDGSANSVAEHILAGELQTLRSEGALVVVQSVNRPKVSGNPQWGELAAQIQALGGTGDLFNRLNGSGNYALIGCGGCQPQQVVESDADQHPGVKGAGTISGTLAPIADSELRPSISGPGSVGQQDAPLEAGLTRGPVAWPALDSPGKRAAYAEIWTEAKSPNDDAGAWEQLASDDRSAWCEDRDELDAAYCDDNVHWGSFQTWVAGLTAVSGDGFTAADFTAVKHQILTDLGAREQVKKIISNLKTLATDSSSSYYLDASTIATTITSYTKPTGTADQLAAGLLELTNLGLQTISYTGEEEVAASAGLAAEALSTASGAIDDSQGDSIVDLTPSAQDLGAKLEDAITDSAKNLDHVQALILSDPAKLQAWGETTGKFGLDETSLDKMVDGLKIGTSQYMWEQLLPKAWWLLKAQAPPPGHRLNSLKCTPFETPLADLNDGASYQPIVGFNANRTPITQWWTMDNGIPLYQTGELKFAADPKYEQFFAGPSGADPGDPLKPGLDKATFYRDVQGQWLGVDDQTGSPVPYPSQCSY
jgi:hypothetical protein